MLGHHTFELNFGMKYRFAIYLKESCRLSSDEWFFLKYFLNIAFVSVNTNLFDCLSVPYTELCFVFPGFALR